MLLTLKTTGLSEYVERTELAEVSCDVVWTWIARESATKWKTLGTVHARVTRTVVVVCINIIATQ